LECDCGQGFFFSKPLPADEIEQAIIRPAELRAA
jgi:EAL domain-containing protein (putative c-di-GMP-specific phosphodiesterase class I)